MRSVNNPKETGVTIESFIKWLESEGIEVNVTEPDLSVPEQIGWSRIVSYTNSRGIETEVGFSGDRFQVIALDGGAV